MLKYAAVGCMLASAVDLSNGKMVRAEDVASSVLSNNAGIQRLQSAIETLEQSNSRAQTVQAMADLYEAVQLKPLTAKSTKVKTVSIMFLLA